MSSKGKFWFDEYAFQGNRNQFETEEECKKICIPGYEKDKAMSESYRIRTDMQNGQEYLPQLTLSLTNLQKKI